MPPTPPPATLALPLTWRNRFQFFRMAFAWKRHARLALWGAQPSSGPLDAFRVPTPSPPPLLTPVPLDSLPPPSAAGTRLLIRLIGRRHMNSTPSAEEHLIHLFAPLTRETTPPAVAIATRDAIRLSDFDPSLIETAHIFINPPPASVEG